MILIAVILTLLTIAVKLWHDLRVHYKNVKNGTAIGINHGKEARFMTIANTPSLVLFTLASSLPWYFAGLLSLAMILFTVWTLFDGFYGLGKGKGFFYTGDRTYSGTAKSDSFLRRLSLWQHIALKLGGLVVLVYIYFSHG